MVYGLVLAVWCLLVLCSSVFVLQACELCWCCICCGGWLLVSDLLTGCGYALDAGAY